MQSDRSFEFRFKWFLKFSIYIWLNVLLLIAGLVLSIFTDGWPQAVGTSLLASALVGFLFFYQIRIDSQFDLAREMFGKYGLVRLHPERGDKELYREHMARCQRSFDIIGHSLSRLYDDLAKELLPAMDSRGVQMRILLLDPESPFVLYREREDDSPDRADLAAEIRKSLTCYRQLGLENLSIKYYDCTPTLTYQKIDAMVFGGPYFVGVPSTRQPALVIRADHPLAYAYQQHFETVWNKHSRNAE
jgi:hypothetical protein